MNQYTRHDSLGRTLANLGRLLRVELSRQMQAHGLSFPQWQVLRTLAEKGDGVVQKELAEALGIEGATLVGLLDRLARAGWVERREAAHDRRYKTVHLTPGAHARLAPLYGVQEAVWQRLLDGIPPAEVAACQAMLERLLARAQRSHELPPISTSDRNRIVKARTSPQADENLSVATPARRRGLRWLPWVLGLGMLAAILAFGGNWLAHRFAYVSEVDARVSADMIILSPVVAGRIVQMPAAEGAVLAKGDPVLVIDNREALLQADELEARLAGVAADRKRLAAETELVEQQTSAQMDSEQAKLRAAQALVESLAVQRRYADGELVRAEKLAAAGTMPRRDLDRIRTTALQSRQEAARAEAQAATAQAELGAARAARQQLAVLQQEMAQLDHKARELSASLERARIAIGDHVLRAPTAGVISRTFVTAGEFVSPGQRVALLHDPEAIYVEALIKETEIGRLKLGQPVALHVDAYPDESFTGTVARIGHAATSEFSLLPNPNPSGNFTKVSQRLPVKIAVQQVDGKLRPGMMVEVDIDVR